MFVDLHLHTNFSDGTYSPEELAFHADRNHLKAIALTDHDTVEGCPRALAACKERGIEFIPASELTAELNGNEIHLIGYFLDINHPRITSEFSKFQAVRQSRIREMVTRLNSLKIPLKEEVVFEIAHCRSPGRPHVARALVQEGFCSSMDEAFDRFLKKNRPAWVPKLKVSTADAIQLIHDGGGLAVMAHPGLNRSDEVIPLLVEAGLDGLECFHSKHTAGMSEHYIRIAKRWRLLITGGSDCHGMSKGKPLIGSVKVPYDCVEQMWQRKYSRTIPHTA